jgi:sarcosine oxidase, subunit gamma
MSAAVRWSRVTDRARTGCKGPGAAEWLSARGIAAPPASNTWLASDADGGLVARLGSSEFFIEAHAPLIAALDAALTDSPPGVYPVLRADAAFLIEGEAVHEVLAQVCNIEFAALDLARSPVIMTLMIGVAVLVVPESAGAGRRYRVWCDPSYGEYLDQELGAVVVSLKQE